MSDTKNNIQYPKPYLDSNDSRDGGGSVFYNNMPASLTGLNTAYLNNPFRDLGGKFEDYYFTGADGKWHRYDEYDDWVKNGDIITYKGDAAKNWYKENVLGYKIVVDDIITGTFPDGSEATIDGDPPGGGVHDYKNKALAKFLKYSPVIPIPSFPFISPNPFLGADAIMSDGGATLQGELDYGFIFVLSGNDAGLLKTYDEHVAGFSSDAGVGFEVVRVDLIKGNTNDLKISDFAGMRYKIYGGAEIYGLLSAGGSVSISSPRENWIISATGIQTGIGVSMFGGFYGGFNWGNVNIHP